MTRVLHILDHSLPLHSGYAFRTRAILKAQTDQGLEVRSITGQRHGNGMNEGTAAGDGQSKWRLEARGAPEVYDGLVFDRTPGRPAGVPGVREFREVAAFARSIERLCGHWRPDVLHAHSPALCGLAAARVAKKLGIPLVYEIRAFWEDAAIGNGGGSAAAVKYWLTRSLENRVVASADAVVTICRGLQDDLVARGYGAKPMAIMPNGVDLDLFGDPPPRDTALAAELGLGEGPVIGFLGSFYPYEGLDDLIAAMPAILAARPGAKLLLVGGGQDQEALRRQAEASPASAAIRFVGRVPHSEVERYYSLVDVVCYPRKGMRLTELVTPLKPLEAMAQGKLVAASDVGGHCELIENGVTGCLFTPDDPAACAAALIDLLARPETWDERRRTARAFVESHHDWATNVQRYEDVYHQVLGRTLDEGVAAAA